MPWSGCSALHGVNPNFKKSLFLRSNDFLAGKANVFLNYFGLKNPLFMFSEWDFSVVNLINH